MNVLNLIRVWMHCLSVFVPTATTIEIFVFIFGASRSVLLRIYGNITPNQTISTNCTSPGQLLVLLKLYKNLGLIEFRSICYGFIKKRLPTV
jgi:hypothetical protein